MRKSPLRNSVLPLRRKRLQRHARQLARKVELKAKARLRPVNPERRARLREKQFGPHHQLFHVLPCVECHPERYRDARTVLATLERYRERTWRTCDPAHVKGRGAGGEWRGNIVPLCSGPGGHHDRERAPKAGPPDKVAAMGRRAWLARVARDLTAALEIPAPAFDMAACFYELAGGSPGAFALRLPTVVRDLEAHISNQPTFAERYRAALDEVRAWARSACPWALASRPAGRAE